MTANRIAQLDHLTRGRLMFDADRSLLEACVASTFSPNKQIDRGSQRAGSHFSRGR